MKERSERIEDVIGSLNIQLVTPSFGSGWTCDWKNCGLCCITEITEYHDKRGCAQQNKRTKACKIYESRPLNCRGYPFMFIQYEKGVVVSPSLNCPFVLDATKSKSISLSEILSDSFLLDFLTSGFDHMRTNVFPQVLAMLEERLADRYGNKMFQLKPIDVNKIIEKNIDVFIKDPFNGFKKFELDCLKDFMISTEFPEQEKLAVTPDIYQALRESTFFYGMYIQPNLNKDGHPNPLVTRIRLTKNKDKIFFKNRLGTKTVSLDSLSFNTEISDETRDMLEEYVNLILNRHMEMVMVLFFSKFGHLLPPSYAYFQGFINMIRCLYVSLVVLSNRDKVGIVDAKLMRDVLSCTDANVHGYLSMRDPGLKRYKTEL